MFVLKFESSMEETDIAKLSEEEYNEEEDEDFDPTKGTAVAGAEVSDGEDDDEDDEDDSRVKDSYSHIVSESGGLVKTRRARQQEEEFKRKNKYEGIVKAAISEKVGSIWEDLKKESLSRLHNKENDSVISESSKLKKDNHVAGEEMVTIERVYKFAGETIREKKTVPISSAEAVEYLNNLKFRKSTDQAGSTKRKLEEIDVKENNNTNEDTSESGIDRKKLRRPLKRPPFLEQIISGALKPKLSTLEKSKLDWATYVDKEGINDELSAHNKDGYLAKQDFLNKVDSVKENEYKELRRKEMMIRLQETK